jgi:hypothetical protein
MFGRAAVLEYWEGVKSWGGEFAGNTGGYIAFFLVSVLPLFIWLVGGGSGLLITSVRSAI